MYFTTYVHVFKKNYVTKFYGLCLSVCEYILLSQKIIFRWSMVYVAFVRWIGELSLNAKHTQIFYQTLK